jgi:zinc protease
MKKSLILILSLIAIGFVFSCSSLKHASELNKKLPVDEKIRIGKLKNGFTYYIKYNRKPEKRVEMRLAVNAGSILEDEDQRGLAHFIEHMCFNGTKHFEKNELINYLQSAGIKFGPEINAYTSFDETVYMLSLPTDSADILNNGYLVMEDWAHNVTFNEEEIDKERGVVIEEWRMGRGPSQRMLDKYLPVLYKNSRYAERLPIGKKEIIENADYETIKRFYRDWYRPDLMALIVVGDIDADEAEKKIKEHFNNLELTENPRKRILYDVPDHEETLISINTDREAPVTTVRIYHKTDAKINKTYSDYRDMLVELLFYGMLNQRLDELLEKPDPPFINAGCYYGSSWARTKYAFQSYALVAENGIERGLKALFEENLRVKRHGFTQGELDRYKKDILRFYENAYSERDKTESATFAAEYIRGFLEEEPLPGIEFEYSFARKHIPGITLEEVNALADKWIRDNNRVIVVTTPEKENINIPAENDLNTLISDIEKSDISPYEDKQLQTTLIENVPEKGAIVSEKRIEEIDVTELVLSNYVKVVLKSTDFKNDEIVMSAYSPGGHSLYPDEDHQSAINSVGIISESGVNGFSNSDLTKMLAGKAISIAPEINYYSEGFSGSASPKDMEALFQLIYLYFTDPRKDESTFQSYITKQKALYKNLLSDPVQFYFDQYIRIKSNNHPRGRRLPLEEDFNKVDFQKAMEIYYDRFADASDFTFFFVGTFNIDSIKPLIETYIASLPDTDREETWIDLNIRPPEGKTEKVISKGVDQKSFVSMYFEKEVEWNQNEAYLFWTLGRILDRIYIDVLREEMSGVYNIQSKAGINKIPYGRAYLQIIFPCSPEYKDSLTNVALAEIKKIQVSGVKDEDILKAKEIQRREIEKSLKQNSYWLRNLRECYVKGTDFSRLTDYDKIIDGLTSEELQRVAKEYINLDEYIMVVLVPETE